MTYIPETVKGFQDFLPPESIKRKKIMDIVEKWFKLFGFVPIETPIIEFDELMRPNALPSEGLDEVISERFRLQDRGGRNLGLRYEFTFQLARTLKQNPNIKMPFKRYQIGPVFRDEPVSTSRFRQFTQCDIDIIGDQTISADAECLACFAEILKELKIQFEIQINNRALLESIIKSVEIQNVKQVIRELDKIDKLGIDTVKANLRKYANANQILTLIKLLEKDFRFFEQNAFPGVEEIEQLTKLCKFYSIKLNFNPFLMRGLAYYTGNVFEILSTNEDAKNSLAGGGRYDKTVGRFLQKDIPAVGISFGLERLSQIAQITIPDIPKVLIISIEQDEKAIALVKTLRKNKISCSITSDKPSKALEYANAYNIPLAIFIGSEEITQKKFKLKNMASGEEKLLNEKQLINKLK